METDEYDDLFPGGKEKVWPNLLLYRVAWGTSVSYLVAAHSYEEACQEVLRVWPERSCVVWRCAGLARDGNLPFWKNKVLNADAPIVRGVE